MSQFEPGTQDRNGVPFDDKQVAVRESLNIPNFHEDKATVAINTAGMTRAPNQSTPQTFIQEALGMSNEINSTDAGNLGMLKNNIEMANTDSINTNVAGVIITVSKKQQKKKIKGATRKRFERLLKEGIPHEEARRLCRLPWIILEKMLLNNTHKIWYNNSGDPQGPAKKYVKVSAGFDDPNSDAGAAALNIPGFQGDKADVAQNRAGLIKAPNQSTPQTFSKEALSMGMNNRLNSNEARNSGMLNNNIELAKTDGMNTNVVETTNTESDWFWTELTRVSRKRYHKLTERGIPQDEARKLCRMPWSTLEKMLLNYPRNGNPSEEPQGPANNLEVSAGMDEQKSVVVPVRAALKIPGFQGDKADVAQNRAGLIKAPNQSTPQTFSKEALSMGKNNGMNSTEARNSGMFNSNIELATTDGINSNDTDTEYNWNWKKLSQSARKRYHKLKEEGIPQEEARKLCRLPCLTVEEILLNYPRKRSMSEDPQGPANKNLKMTTDENFNVPLRVGIVNSKPMSEDQMKMLHQHLILTIMEQCSDGEGPEFLGFSHKTGWVLVTCANQRSKDWLVHEVPYQEPWPEAQLSIIPEEELPKPPTAVTFIPVAEAASVEEAMTLLKAQNEGLNTELWEVRFEKVENGVRKLSFTIDDPSADVLRAQNCEAAISFTMVSFKIKGQYKPYPKVLTRSQDLATPQQSAVPGSSSKPQGSQSLGGKSSDQVTSKLGPSSAPRATGRVAQPIPNQNCQPSAEKTPFAQGSSGGTSWEPAALATVGRSVFQTRDEIRALPIIKISQGHGTFAQKDQGESMIGEPSTSARGLLPQAARGRAVQPIQDSRKRSISKDPQGPANKNLKMATDENPDVSLRVGIVNSKPMSEDQMKMLHQNLLLALTEQWRRMDEEGPEFVGFSHKAGWFLVTCSNQHSKDWLLHEVLYLQPWPEAQLSIIPEEELPKPPTAVTFIPEAAAASVEEAMSLLKAQNEGLNTELWEVRFEKVENGVRKLSFTIDDPSADVLRAQNCEAAISFTMVSFKIKGQYKPYPKVLTRSQDLSTPKQSAMPGSSSKPQGSQSLGGKSSDQATRKVGPSSADKEFQLPRATGRVVQPILHQDCQPSAEKTPFAQGSSGGTSWEPAALATVGRSVPQTRGEFQALPIIQNSQGHGTFAHKDQGGSMIGEPSTSARGLLPRAARGRVVQPIQDSQIETPFAQGSRDAGGRVLGLDGSVLATRRSSQRHSPRPSSGHSRASAINQDIYPSQAPGGMYQTRNNSPNHEGTFSFNKGGTATEGYDQGNLGDLTLTDIEPDRELSPDAEGGYDTWVIEDLESFGARFAQNIPGIGTLSSATGLPLASYRDQSLTQFTHGSTGIPANPEITLNRGLLPQAWDGYGAMIIESESHGNPFQDGRTVNEQESRCWGLLPHLSGDFERIELENHGPFQGSKGIDRESMPGRGTHKSHKARGFGAGVQKPKRRPFQSRGKLADGESRPLLPHPSGFQSQAFKSENHGRSFHGRRTVGNRDSRSNRVRSPRASCYQGQYQSHQRLFRGSRTGREPRSDRRSPHARRGYDARSIENPESCGSGTTDRNGSSTAGLREERTSLSGRKRRKPHALLARGSGTVEQRGPW